MALSSSTTPFLSGESHGFPGRTSTKLVASLRSRPGLTPATNLGPAAARSQRAFGAGLKSSRENAEPNNKPLVVKKQSVVGALRLRDVIMENSAPKSAQRSKGQKKRQRGLNKVTSQESGFLTPARPHNGASTHVQGKMRIFTDQSSVFSRRRRALTPARTTVLHVPTFPSDNASQKGRSGETSSDDMDLTDNESCTIQSQHVQPLRNIRAQKTFTSPAHKSLVRGNSPSLKHSVHPVEPRSQDFDQTRSIWERRESLASSPSREEAEIGGVAHLVSSIVAPSLSCFDYPESESSRVGAGPGGLPAAPRTITALNKTKSITAGYTTAVNRALSPKTSTPNTQAHSTRLVTSHRSLRGATGTNRVRTRVSALNTSISSRTLLAPLSPTRSPTRTKGTRPLKGGRIRHRRSLKNSSSKQQRSRWDRRRASQHSLKSDCSDDSLLETEFVFPLPGSDAEKKLKQAIQGASVYEGFDREEIETLTQLKRIFSEIVAPSLSAYDIPDEELERLLTDYSTTSTATTWSTRTVDTEDPAFCNDSDDEQEHHAYTDVPEFIPLGGLNENLNIEFSGGGETVAEG